MDGHGLRLGIPWPSLVSTYQTLGGGNSLRLPLLWVQFLWWWWGVPLAIEDHVFHEELVLCNATWFKDSVVG